MPKRLLRIAGYCLAGLLALCVLAFAFRNEIAGIIVENYLAGEGIGGKVSVLRLGSGGASLKFTLGPDEAPDASAEEVDVVIGKGPYGGRVEAVTLRGAFMHVRYDGKTITYGSLTDFIERILNEPATENNFVVKDLPVRLSSLRVRVTTPGGSVDLVGEGAIRGSQIEWLNLNATQGQAGLYGYGYGYKADIDAIALRMMSNASGLNVAGNVKAAIKGNVDLESIDLTFASRQISFGPKIVIPHLELDAAVTMSGAQSGKFASAIPYWSGDAQNYNALKAALMNFSAEIRDTPLVFEDNRIEAVLGLTTIRSRSGAEISLSGDVKTQGSSGKANVFLTLEEGGFAPTRAWLRNIGWQSAGTRTEGEARLETHFTAQDLRDADIAGRFRFVTDGISLRLHVDDCAKVALGGFGGGRRQIARRLGANVCALEGQPLYAMDTKGWRARVRFADGTVHVVAANAQVSGARGSAMIDGAGDPKIGVVTIEAAKLSDAARVKRFGALSTRGGITLANGVWRGDADVSHAIRRTRIGKVRFSHVTATGAGEAKIDARGIVFKENGLQPVDLSPLLVNFAKAEGTAGFTGTIAWRGSKLTSSGELKVDDSRFATPLGPAHGGSVAIKFSSLIPIIAAPGQQAGIDRIDWISALTESSARFGFTQDALTLQAAGTHAAKGTVRLDPLTIHFASDKGMAGRLVLEKVDLGQLLADSNLGEDVKIVARISGAVPFEVNKEGFRIREGRIAADGPGRLSIKKSLWLGARKEAASAMEDFAYQALENLAFDKLEGTLNSLPGGRMQLVFRIVGYNDPANPVETRVDVMSLVQGKAFEKPLPLPKGTPIDLTLDTNLNFDEVLRAYRDAWADTKAESRERISQ